MKEPQDIMLRLRVEDVMSCPVTTISSNNTMSEAADILCHQSVTGAPVVDELGRCVGVLSGTDFVHNKASEIDGDLGSRHVLTQPSSKEAYRTEDIGHNLVRYHMSPAVQTVDRHAPIPQAARCMCQEHVHRLIVVDKQGNPCGILTSLDLIAAVIGSNINSPTKVDR